MRKTGLWEELSEISTRKNLDSERLPGAGTLWLWLRGRRGVVGKKGKGKENYSNKNKELNFICVCVHYLITYWQYPN